MPQFTAGKFWRAIEQQATTRPRVHATILMTTLDAGHDNISSEVRMKVQDPEIQQLIDDRCVKVSRTRRN